jgi:predicted flap endonuclease-1-like 5' DNA nuclease
VEAPPKPAAPASASTSAAAAAASAAAAAVTAAATPRQAASTAPLAVGGDDLKRIRGISPEIERELGRRGVTRYAHIAAWHRQDIERLSAELSIPGRIERENWVEQAVILAKGGETEFSRRLRKTEPAAAASAEATPSPAPKPETRAPYTPPVSRNVRSAEPDDLKRIRGVGVVIEKKLNALGVTSYQDIASWTDADIERVSEALDFKGRIERERWVEQARILTGGGQTDFSRRVDRGEVAGEPPKTEGT